MPAFTHDRPIDRNERKELGLRARAAYPTGYRPVEVHPVLYCRASDRHALRTRLEKQPWRHWYEDIHRPLAEVALAARTYEDLLRPGFNLEVFPLERPPAKPVHAFTERDLWRAAIVNCKVEGMLDQYVEQVLYGEGEYYEGSSYQAGCMEPETVRLTDRAFGNARRIVLDDADAGLTRAGECALTLEKAGHHSWRIE